LSGSFIHSRELHVDGDAGFTAVVPR